jgi:hypothetical protein
MARIGAEDSGPMSAAAPPRVRHVDSLAAIASHDWNRLFPGRAEDWGYFRACEPAGPQGFSTSAIAAYAGDELVAAAPIFRTDYRLDMSLEGALQRSVAWIRHRAPKLVAVPMLGIGSPLTEECPIGFAPGMSSEARAATLQALLTGLDAYAAAEHVPLVALKDITHRDNLWAQAPLTAAGFTGIPTLPIATLHLPFASVDEYLGSLSANMRSSLKKKMKQAANVAIEFRRSIDGIEAEIAALFQETHAHRKSDYGVFDDVPEAYFREVLASAGGNAGLMLCRVDGELVSFNIHLIEANRVLGKYIGMRYPAAREHNLYFVNWMAMVQLCIERGIPWLQTGQTAYLQKARFGCQLKRSWIYARHRNRAINPLLKLLGPRMAFDKTDPDLRALGSAARYLDAGVAP